MQPAQDSDVAGARDRASRSPISVALLAGMAFVPIVVAAGFLTDPGEPALPGDISVAAIRGAFDHPPSDRPPTVRAGF